LSLIYRTTRDDLFPILNEEVIREKNDRNNQDRVSIIKYRNAYLAGDKSDMT